MNELPSITSSSYCTSAVDPALWINAGQNNALQAQAGNDLERRIMGAAITYTPPIPANQPKENHVASARIVKVYIADSNENLPLDKRVLHSGAEQLTDLTDQELFFEIPISDLLKVHNEMRAKTLDKKASEKFGRDIYLEPARIRDLKMVVVAVAQF